MAHRPPKDGTQGATKAPPRTAHLSVVSSAAAAPGAAGRLEAFVRSVRRDMARLLRALQATGRPVGALPDAVLSRVAHLDAVTARFLAGTGAGDRAAVEDAAMGLRSLERWIVGHLSPSERAEVRLAILQVRLSEDEVRGPLVHVDLPAGPDAAPAGPRTLRAGLATLDPAARRRVARRLGIARHRIGPATAEPEADPLVAAVTVRLVDGHLLGVLVATLSEGARHLLERIVGRGAAPVGPGFDRRALDELLDTALVFLERDADPPVAWVPVDLHRRIDGVLRSLAPSRDLA